MLLYWLFSSFLKICWECIIGQGLYWQPLLVVWDKNSWTPISRDDDRR